jgi:hypothetical protein
VPLPSGHFNLEQALWELGRIRSNLDLAAQIVRKQDAKEAKPALVGCAPEGRRIYVKQVPAHVPTSLGSLILPSIVELTGDGVPEREVRLLAQQAKRQADAEASRILAAAEAAHSRLEAGIKTEYDAMRAGGSHVVPLLDDAEGLVVRALKVCATEQ